MTNKKIVIALVVIAIIATIGWVLPVGQDGQTVVEKLGISAGPESTNNYQCYSGICTYFRRVQMRTATTTVCAIKTPPVQSVLRSLTIRYTTSSTTASTVTVATSTTAFATTSLLSNYSIGASATSNYVLMASSTGISTSLAFPASSYINVSMAGGVGTFSPVGVCNAEFISAQ